MKHAKKIATPAQRIKEALVQRQMNQTDLSELTEYSQPVISRWVKGRNQPREAALARLSDALGVSTHWLAGYAVPMEEGGDMEEYIIPDEARESRRVFAKNLSYHLNRIGEKHKDVAAAIGVARSSFSSWVTGHTYPRPEKMQKLAQYFGVTVADLLKDRSAIILDDDMIELLELYKQCNSEQKHSFKQMLYDTVNQE